MRKLGFDGGHTVYELGPISDVVLFFECLNAFVVSKYPDRDWSLLSDRLYKRYLRRGELDESLALMEEAKSIFLTLPSSSVEWDEDMQADRDRTWLDSRVDNLGEVFYRYFDLFSKAKDSAVSFLDEFGIYQPVRILASDIPALFFEKNRPLNEYDALELSSLPFWLR
ncbi:hypothetical protein [Pseudomonas sp. Irchel 3A5]|uniref:hypothetical protein n=1 Tax=Pseudomonas sp. Irchel 3A5 TaxID=2008911 RepID=UPI000BA4C6A3|nr:hypothetical protein [Pseudomonas sp. Irchel 3A5]